MRAHFHNRDLTLVALAVGGLVGLGKDLLGGVVYLYRFALTPQGSAAVQVGTFVLLAAMLVISLLRR